MKTNFIRLFMEPDTKTGGFTPEEKSELGAAIKDLQQVLESKQKTLMEAELKKHADVVNESIKKFADKDAERDEADLKNQKALDEVLLKFSDMQKATKWQHKEAAKPLQVAIAEALDDPDNVKSLQSVSKGHRAKIALKGVIDMSAPNVQIEHKAAGDMTTGNIVGQGVVSYANRQVILPAQKINARDLIPTVRSETGIYVNYRETGGEGAPARQVEGNAKALVDYDFTEVKTVSEYIAGITRFSKQLTKHLPFFTGTLPRLLQRDFFKVENRRFWDILATNATGSTTTSETDDVKQIMDYLTNLLDSDYVASYGLLRYTALNRLNKLLYTNGYYQGSGGVLSQSDGSIRIMGVPIIPVTFIPSFDKFLTLDNDYVERIEVEGLSIEFFQEDSDNVQKNLITARIECMEEFNLLQPKAAIVADLGNSSSS